MGSSPAAASARTPTGSSGTCGAPRPGRRPPLSCGPSTAEGSASGRRSSAPLRPGCLPRSPLFL
eukprot:1565127-Pyramimonas_sp.AAC.1